LKLLKPAHLITLLLLFVFAMAWPGVLPAGSQAPIDEELPVIASIDFTMTDTSEKICVEFNIFRFPEIIPLEGEKPRVAIDIKNIQVWDGDAVTPLDGNLIQNIRTYLNPKTDVLRIVMDLNPLEDYLVNPSFYTDRNVFCLEIIHQSVSSVGDRVGLE
jgi:hypothetical protein